MRKQFLFVYFCFVIWSWSCGGAFAQSKEIDSLREAIRNYTLRDSAKVNLLNELCGQLLQSDHETEAKKYADEALALSSQINYKKGEANAHSMLGNIYHQQDNHTLALNEHQEALKIRVEIGDVRNIAYSRNRIGSLYRLLGNFPDALREHLAALKIFEELGDKKGIAQSHRIIGIIYKNQGNYADALKESNTALKIQKQIGDLDGIANSYNNIGNIYYEQGQYADALKHHFASLKIKEKSGNKFGIASSHTNIGNIYYKQGDYPGALREAFAALEMYEKIGSKTGIAASYIDIGNIYIRQKKFKEASEFLNKGLSLSKEIGVLTRIRDCYVALSTLDSAQGNYKHAFENHKLFIAARDSLVNDESTKKTLQLQLQYDFDKKQVADSLKFAQEKEIGEVKLQKQKALTYGGYAGVLITIILLFFVYRNYSKQRIANQQLKEAQQQLIKSEKMAAFGIMATRVAHEIQNPLNFVNNFSELSKDVITDIINAKNEEEKQQHGQVLIDNLQKINGHGKRAATIINQLQEHTRKGSAHEFFEENN